MRTGGCAPWAPLAEAHPVTTGSSSHPGPSTPPSQLTPGPGGAGPGISPWPVCPGRAPGHPALAPAALFSPHPSWLPVAQPQACLSQSPLHILSEVPMLPLSLCPLLPVPLRGTRPSVPPGEPRVPFPAFFSSARTRTLWSWARGGAEDGAGSVGLASGDVTSQAL